MKDFEKKLFVWYRKNGRKNLPWRKIHITAYEVWVSEIFLQQTQVNRVVSYYARFLKRFPDVGTLANASWSEFFPYYEGLGYYQRGRNMLKTARLVVKKHGGRFPKDYTQLMTLPGIGEYTAHAILVFAYGKDVLAFDTNLQRVFGRYIYGDKNAKYDTVQLEKSLQGNKSVLNAAIMDFANAVCVKRPQCEVCPLSGKCVYFRENGVREQEGREVRKKFSTKKAHVYLWLHKDHKEYYSTNKKIFRPFILPQSLQSRDEIKNYFKNKYGLTLSVRPPHKKTYVDGKPTLFVNAQILLGKNPFHIFIKK